MQPTLKTAQYPYLQYRTVQYSTVQYSTVQYPYLSLIRFPRGRPVRNPIGMKLSSTESLLVLSWGKLGLYSVIEFTDSRFIFLYIYDLTSILGNGKSKIVPFVPYVYEDSNELFNGILC